MPRRTLELLLIAIFSFNMLAGTSAGQALPSESAAQKLESAIGALRHIDPSGLSESQLEKKSAEIDNAWSVIRAAGKDGIARLKQEIARIDSSGEKDDFFKLNASRLLWQMAHFDEALTIARIWDSTPVQNQYYYVFYTAFEAALTQDPRALPLLRACLKDKNGKLFIVMHSLDVQWPLTIEFLWGAFGTKGLPVLAEILETSKDAVELQSAAALLSEAQYVEALPAIRRLAARGDIDKATRSIAVRVLGTFGHPQDYAFLAGGLKSKDPDTLTDFAYALYEFEDLRAVPLLVPLLKSENGSLKQEVTAALVHLTSVESFDALSYECSSKPTAELRQRCLAETGQFLEGLPINLATFPGLSADAKSSLITSMRKSAEEDLVPQEHDQKLSREDLLQLLDDWKRNHRLKSDKFDWAEPKHILSIATARDLDNLIETRAAIYGRLSDECLYEVATLNGIIRRLGRSRYRKVAGLTENSSIQ